MKSFRRNWLILQVLLALAFCGTSFIFAQAPERSSKAEKEESTVPPALKVYKGRRIAQTMHYTGAEWLIRNEREREERCSLMLTNLGLKRRMKVCDMGCGNGFYSLKMAKIVSEEGRIYASDIQPQMLFYLRQRMEKAGVENITPILGSFHDPRLPEGVIDLVLLVDVYHEFSHPEHMLAAMRKSLAPGGLIVLVEYREEDPAVPIKPLHKMSKKQVMEELSANGFKLTKEFNRLPWQHMMFFARDDDKTAGPAITPVEYKRPTRTNAPRKLAPQEYAQHDSLAWMSRQLGCLLL